MIRVAVVDDHPVVTEGLMTALQATGDIEVAWTAGSLRAARRALEVDGLVDVVLLDVRLPDGSGLDLLPGQRDHPPAYLVLSSWDRPQYSAAAFRRGAAGYLLKVAPLPSIVAAIHKAAAGGLAFEARQLASVRGNQTPTAREVAVIRLVADGLSNDEIAVRLGIARKTVEAYLTKLFERGGFTTRTELAVWAEREGWLDPGVGG
jgi:two-component system, NarL family, response regulator DevR